MSSQLKSIYKELKNEYSKKEVPGSIKKKIKILYDITKTEKTRKHSIIINIPWKELTNKQKIDKVNLFMIASGEHYYGNVKDYVFKNITYDPNNGRVKNMEWEKKN